MSSRHLGTLYLAVAEGGEREKGKAGTRELGLRHPGTFVFFSNCQHWRYLYKRILLVYCLDLYFVSCNFSDCLWLVHFCILIMLAICIFSSSVFIQIVIISLVYKERHYFCGLCGFLCVFCSRPKMPSSKSSAKHFI